MSGRITVRRVRAHLHFAGANRNYIGTEVWSIWRDGERVWDYAVAWCQYGMTVVHTDGVQWRMVDCWHTGIKPGDLARLHFGRKEEE